MPDRRAAGSVGQCRTHTLALDGVSRVHAVYCCSHGVCGLPAGEEGIMHVLVTEDGRLVLSGGDVDALRRSSGTG
mgnify:CR=1 FL=1